MDTLNRLPWAAQNSVFQRLAEIAEVSAMLRGESESRAEGRKEGEREGLMKMARNLKAMGLNIDDIVKASGLTAEEVAAL